MRVSNEVLKHTPKKSVLEKRLILVKPEPKKESILQWEHRDKPPKCWDRRVMPGFTFENLVLPDPDLDAFIRQLQSSQRSNAFGLSAEAVARVAKDASLQAKDVLLQAQVEALEAAGGVLPEADYTTWTIQGIYDTGVNVDTGMMGHDFVGIRNDGRVIWHDDSAFTSYIISPGGESVGYSSRHTEF